ncbi:hypothetical protein KZ843_06685 [Pseudomonas aeruginosa]|nr:hypothetical protein [Pseudomonas aeruginosa]MBW6122578.1 hypothetical protein [Pseudomonas aeruginosa]
MKYTWEECDIHVGRHVDSHNRAERYVIGYDPRRNHEDGNLTLVSLRDGMQITQEHTEASLADYLNDKRSDVSYGFRPVDIRQNDIPSQVTEPLADSVPEEARP